MKDAQKPDHVSLTTLLYRLREGHFVIPDFQREFEWKPWDIRELIRSIFSDYYIGSLLLWRGKPENLKALACEPIYGFSGDSDPLYIVLDGQQRLTAMYYAFMAPDVPVPGRSNRFLYFVRVDEFVAENYDEAFIYEWTSRGVNLLDNREVQFKEHMFPLAVVGQGGWELPYWLQEYKEYWKDKQTADACRRVQDAEVFSSYLREISERYQVAYIELDRDLEIDKVCDIFTRINSRGIRLDAFDLINALLKPKGLQLKHIWREAAPRLDFIETERLNVYVLQVMSILRQAYCSPKYLYYLLPGQERKVRDEDGSLRKEVLVPSTEDFERRWHQAVDALVLAIDLLRHPQEFGAISSKYLPYTSILPAFAALQEAARALPASRRLDAQRKIRHWYWASVFTNRYSGSVESTTARDYLDVKAWFQDDAAEPALISEFKERFRSLDLRRETRHGTSVYNGIFNLLVINGARDWVTGAVPQYSDLDAHHIVPKSWGNNKMLQTSIDSILNRTPLTADTNRKVIGERVPNVYLPELIDENGEELVRETLETHFISPRAFDILMRNPFTEEDFEAFVEERKRTFLEAIEDLLVKARLDLPPNLRQLDARVEIAELALRSAIAEILEHDRTQVPPHVYQKIEERFQAAAKRNPTLNDDDYHSLADWLEFADLQDLKETITNGKLWSRFQKRFVSKATLIGRFDQLTTIRNSLRHSRTMDEIIRKDGEAALLWFEQVLENCGGRQRHVPDGLHPRVMPMALDDIEDMASEAGDIESSNKGE